MMTSPPPDYFPAAVQLVLECEGPLSNDTYDPGGLTKFGIAQMAHPHLDVQNLTRDQAIRVYQREYWFAAGCHLMPFAWAIVVFDCAVNQGEVCAERMAQESLGVAIDGDVGPKTIAAMQADASGERLALFMALRVMRYHTTAGADRYDRGWVKRAFMQFASAVHGPII